MPSRSDKEQQGQIEKHTFALHHAQKVHSVVLENAACIQYLVIII
jgi:hypothetical protein